MGRALKFRRLKRGRSASARSRCGFAMGVRSRMRPWKMACACNVGSSHLGSGAPCQDQVRVEQFKNGVRVIALADGAGSARYSHYGAFVAVKDALQLLSEHFDEAFGPQEQKERFAGKLIKYIQRDLIELSRIGINLTEKEREAGGAPCRSQLPLVPCATRDLACTILAVAVKEDRFVSIHLGDGVVGMEYTLMGRKRLSVISGPENGEFANETHFVTSSEASNKVRIRSGKLEMGKNSRVTGFIAMSDGPEVALYDKKTNSLAAACGKLFGACRSLDAEIMETKLHHTIESVIQRKTNDDCSIAILAR